MQELALILNRKRVRRGSIDFDLPEPLIEFDEWGAMTGVTRAPRNIAHRLIEEFMLAANEAVAAHLEHAGMPSIYRIHEKPDPQARDGVRRGGGALRLFARAWAPIPVKKFAYHRTSGRDGGKKRSEIVLPECRRKISSRITRSWWRRSKASRRSGF